MSPYNDPMFGFGYKRRVSSAKWWRQALIRLCARLVMKTEVRGGITLRVYDTEDDDALQMLHLALDLIEEHSPWIYGQIPKQLPGGIGIQTALGAIATFRPADRSCDIDEDWIAGAWPDEVAAVIIHELTHARIWGRGIESGEKYRFRAEQICVGKELAFVKRLPDSADLAEVIRCRLNNMDADDYTDAAVQRRARYKRLAAFRKMREIGVSARAVRILAGVVYILGSKLPAPPR